MNMETDIKWIALGPRNFIISRPRKGIAKRMRLLTSYLRASTDPSVIHIPIERNRAHCIKEALDKSVVVPPCVADAFGIHARVFFDYSHSANIKTKVAFVRDKIEKEHVFAVRSPCDTHFDFGAMKCNIVCVYW